MYQSKMALSCASLMLLASCAAPTPTENEQAERTIYLVRHAEKALSGDNPPLTARGQARARALAARLTDAGIKTIYSTDFRRTRDTAAPLADRLDLTTVLYDHRSLEGFANQLLASSGPALVVGHSNTTPALVALLGGDPGTPIREADEYDRLYMLTTEPGGGVRTILQRYGN
ncbi:MAG: phosphoglycerate mutase family protein [Pseudomonadales bacterium]